MRDKSVRDERSWGNILGGCYLKQMILETDEDGKVIGKDHTWRNPITFVSGLLYSQRCSLLFKQVIEYGMGLVIRFVD